LSITIDDIEGDWIDWTIDTNPDVGACSGTGDNSGTKTCSISGLEYGTYYRWIIEATDPDGSGRTRQKVCSFTTESEPIKKPNTPTGPVFLEVDEVGNYCTSTTHLKASNIQYRFDWDSEGTHDYSYWSNFVPSGTEVCVEKAWNRRGRFVVKAQARDEDGTLSQWSDGLVVIVGSQPPSKPSIDGPTNGKAGKSYTYKLTSSDPDNDQISYFIKWGDGTTPVWSAFQNSGTTYSASHTWESQGTFTIEVKAKDIIGAESDWVTLEVTMPRGRILLNTLIQRLLERFPNLFIIFRHINGL
jgi:hypothetical protein